MCACLRGNRGNDDTGVPTKFDLKKRWFFSKILCPEMAWNHKNQMSWYLGVKSWMALSSQFCSMIIWSRLALECFNLSKFQFEKIIKMVLYFLSFSNLSFLTFMENSLQPASIWSSAMFRHNTYLDKGPVSGFVGNLK